MKPRVYVETSVVRYLTGSLSHDIRTISDQIATREWWRNARATFELVASPLVFDDVGSGDTHQAHESLSVLESLVTVHPSETSEVLVQKLTDSRAIPDEAAQDAMHIAIAVTSGVEFLATWNFCYIANPANASKINLVCRDAGYRPTVICTPEQLMGAQDGAPDDPMIAETRKYRDLQAARFGYDAAEIIRHYRALHKASGRASVQYPAIRLEPTSAPDQIGMPRPDEATPSDQE